MHLHMLVSAFPVDNCDDFSPRGRRFLAFGWYMDNVFVAFTFDGRCNCNFAAVFQSKNARITRLTAAGWIKNWYGLE